MPVSASHLPNLVEMVQAESASDAHRGTIGWTTVINQIAPFSGDSVDSCRAGAVAWQTTKLTKFLAKSMVRLGPWQRMFFGISTLLSLTLLLSQKTLCSKRSSVCGDAKCVDLTRDSIDRFTAHLLSCSADSLAVELQQNLVTSRMYQRLCLKYIVGSFAVSGKVNEEALKVLRQACNAKSIRHLSSVLEELGERGHCLDTFVQFAARSIEYEKARSVFRGIIVDFMQENWGNMEALIMRTLDVLSTDEARANDYRFILSHLPIELQYAMIDEGTIPLGMIGEVSYIKASDQQLRDLFFLARWSGKPSPRIRNRIAQVDSYFEQFLSDGCIPKEFKSSNFASSVSPGHAAWNIIFRFLDIETLMLVIQSVCVSWYKMHPGILKRDERIRSLYLEDFSRTGLEEVYCIAPWKYCLVSETGALDYLGWLAATGALSKLGDDFLLQAGVKRYLEAMTSGIVLPPETGYGDPLYIRLSKLAEAVYEFSPDIDHVFDKPVFITRGEYEQVIQHLVRKGRILRLPDSQIVDDLPGLFAIIGKDLELMSKLIDRNGGPVKASIGLVMYGQKGEIPKELAELVFTRTKAFKQFIDSDLAKPCKYYQFVAASNLLPELITESFAAAALYQLVISIILYFKDDPEDTEKIVQSLAGRFLNSDNERLKRIGSTFGARLAQILRRADNYSSEDVEFVGKTMARCGLAENSNIS